jgi:hypothetical protein
MPVDAVTALPPHLHSATDREVVLPFAEATEALDYLDRQGWRFLGWEGGVRHRDGRLGHSTQYQGTVTLAGTPDDVQMGLDIIRAEQERWDLDPEVPGGQLLFCLTFDD